MRSVSSHYSNMPKKEQGIYVLAERLEYRDYKYKIKYAIAQRFDNIRK